MTIEGHLREIGTKLWDRGGTPGSGRAAVMVGAGFSRNATPLASVAPHFPGWEDVAQIFVDKLYPACEGCVCETSLNGKPGCGIWKKRRRHLESAREASGALRLAEMFQAVHGRPALEKILATAIPDSHHRPGILHQKLVRLPWADIFTTNWDSLLERAIDLYDRSYSIINAPKQIATQHSPRIVKLHGSLDAGTRLIFTEDDFLSYRDLYSPFVSLVQQSMMENVFLLIGFSGEDPNFLHWLSWVRRQLGDYIQQVYLVDIYPMDEPERRLLSARGVIPLDIGGLGRGPNDYEGAYAAFFGKLQQARSFVRADLQWPERNVYDRARSWEDQVEVWEKRIRNYPEWLALPQRNRLLVASYLARGGELNEINSLIAGEDEPGAAPHGEPAARLVVRARGAAVLVQLCEFARAPVDAPVVDSFIKFLADATGMERKPSPAEFFAQPDAKAKVESLAWRIHATLEQAVAAVLAALLKGARLAGDAAQVKSIQPLLLAAAPSSAEIRCVLAYEEALRCLGRSDPIGTLEAIKDLQPEPSTPSWDLRKAGLLAELGRNEEARRHLRETVDRVRRLRFEPDEPHKEVWQQSREGWAFFSYRALIHEDRHKPDYSHSLTDQDDLPVGDVLEELEDRLSETAATLNDPRIEVAAAEAELIEAAYQQLVEGDTVVGNREGSSAGLAYALLLEAVGVSPRAPRHARRYSPTPLAVTAAAQLWKTNRLYALGLALRSASPSDFERGPLSVRALLGKLSADHTDALLTELQDRAQRLLGCFSQDHSLLNYCENRVSTIAAMVRGLAESHPKLVNRAFAMVCTWHERPAVLPGAYAETRRLLNTLMESSAFKWETQLKTLFALSYPMRPSEAWGDENWPDPFAPLVRRRIKEDDQTKYEYTLSPNIGQSVVESFAAVINEAAADYREALIVVRDRLVEPNIAPILRRLTLIDAASRFADSPRRGRRPRG